MRGGDKNIIRLDFKTSDNKKYKIKKIQNNTIYVKKLEISYLLIVYYLAFFKRLFRKKKYLKVCVNNIILLKTNQLILLRLF